MNKAHQVSANVAAAAADRLAFLLEKSTLFRTTCDTIFEQLDVQEQQHISAEAAAGSVSVLFDKLRTSLTAYGIPIKQPSKPEVVALFQDTVWDPARRLNKAEFHELYAKVFTMAGVNTAQGAAKEYGLAALGGIAGLMILKRTVRTVPVVGVLTSSILGLLPALLVGPAIGVALIYTYKSGDMLALKNRLFPPTVKPNGK